METLLRRAVSFPDWPQTPIPRFNLSAGGLIALADLGTVAQRTALVGGSSWLDALLLAPGLHYQQAADALVGDSGGYEAVELVGGKTAVYSISNPATLNYLRRVSRPGEIVTVDVGALPTRRSWRRRQRQKNTGQRARIWADQTMDFGWLSHLLYLASPALTVVAIVFMVLVQDWWGLASILALMLSRILNIFVIKQRAQPPPSTQPAPAPSKPPPVADKRSSSASNSNAQRITSTSEPPNLLTSYTIHLADRTIRLRGLSSDLQAITATAWLSTKTHIEGFLEAAAKLCVWIVAAFSGNLSQTGGIILMGLLLITAGLLGLSNAHAKRFQMHGRIAAPTRERLDMPYPPDGMVKKGRPGSPPYPPTPGVGLMGENSWSEKGAALGGGRTRRGWAESSTSSGLGDLDDWAEKGQVGAGVRDRYPYDKRLDHA